MKQFTSQSIPMILVNLGIMLLINLLIILFFQSWTVTLLITSILASLWSIANYYVIQFHGSPLFPSEFSNFGTAMAVAGGYKLTLNKTVLRLLAAFAVELSGIVALYWLRKGTKFFRLGRWFSYLVLCIADGALIFFLLYGPNPIKPQNGLVWSWKTAIEKYGYLSCCIESIEHQMNPYRTPPGYNPEFINEIEPIPQTDPPEVLPNIILILNETFYDLNMFTDVAPDKDFMSDFYSIDHANFGYSMATMIGGGTNNSEYELLTANSFYLLRNNAPFNYIDFTKTKNNIVQYMNSLGYNTYAMHCEPGTNYSRNIAYPAMGFDHVILGQENFTCNQYGNRRWLDSDNYNDLIREYEAADDEPCFMYLLTYQNHGGYEQNDASLDLIHTTSDFGDLTDDVDEYLTSMSMSVSAFQELVDYFKNVDRPTIICMVGDHSPSFIKDLTTVYENDRLNYGFFASITPYVIWSNYDVEVPEHISYISIADLMPIILKTAGLPLTTYYQSVLDLKNYLQVFTGGDAAVTLDGQVKSASEVLDTCAEQIYKYFYMEYNGLKGGRDYRAELFELAG